MSDATVLVTTTYPDVAFTVGGSKNLDARLIIKLIPSSVTESWSNASLDNGTVEVTSNNGTKYTFSSNLAHMAKAADFKFAVGSTVHTFNNGTFEAIVGLGDIAKHTANHVASFTKVGAAISSLVNTTKSPKVVIEVQDCLQIDVATTIVEYIVFSSHPDNRYRKTPKPAVVPTHVEFVVAGCPGTIMEGVERGRALALGTLYTRDLVNAPANVCHPPSMSAAVAEMAKACGLEARVYDREHCENVLKMGAFVAVGKGSVHQPHLVHLTYRAADFKENSPKLVFIGKGVTFDSGGYNVKAAMMELMKFDMGGAGAVFGAARAMAELKPENVEVHFISALAENMIANDAYRPGDILTSKSGKTIEVLNTDAEGRLTLADAISYAQEVVGEKVPIVELSTLTGAQLVALGPRVAALMTTDDSLAADVERAAKEAGEYIWRLPLFEEYKENLKSKIADIANLDSSRHAGTISAGLFLNEFAGSTPYAHIDIAGPTWDFKNGSATAYGARLLVKLAEIFGQKK